MTLIAAIASILVCLLHARPAQSADGNVPAAFVSVVDGICFDGVVV